MVNTYHRLVAKKKTPQVKESRNIYQFLLQQYIVIMLLHFEKYQNNNHLFLKNVLLMTLKC